MDKSTKCSQNRGQVPRLALVRQSSRLFTQIAQSLGDDPATELNTEGLPNRRPSSTGIMQLTATILRNVPGMEGTKSSVQFAARVAFLVRHPTPPPCLQANHPSSDTVMLNPRSREMTTGDWWIKHLKTSENPRRIQPQLHSASTRH